MAKCVTVATFYDLPEALVARSCLEARGLVAILPDWHYGSVAWHHLLALQGIRLWALDAEQEDAASLLLNPSDAADQHGQERFAPMAGVWEFGLASLALFLTGLPFPFWRRRWRAMGPETVADGNE